MTLRSVQWLELIWVAMGLSYNAVSYQRFTDGSAPLAPTDPVSGAVFMVLSGVLIVAGMRGWKLTYKFGILPLTILLIYSGLLLHLAAFASDRGLPTYSSFAAWLFAVLINVYGIVVMVLGGWLSWRAPQ